MTLRDGKALTRPDRSAMAMFDDLRAAALTLPGVYEDLHLGGPAFRVKGRKFALWWAQGGRTIMKLDPGRQTLRFEVRPEIFQPCPVGRATWSFVDLDPLDEVEIRALVVEAWSTVAPRREVRALSEERPRSEDQLAAHQGQGGGQDRP
jgi:hypothetical protein